jgi:hypothetical protein
MEANPASTQSSWVAQIRYPLQQPIQRRVLVKSL